MGHFTSSTLNQEGDYDKEYADELVIQSFSKVNKILRKYFPNTPIYPVLGNNDAYADYQILPESRETAFLSKISEYSLIFQLVSTNMGITP